MDELLKLMHDTMNPVATILGAVELLKNKPDISDEDRVKLLDEIEQRAKRINAVLDEYYVSQRAKK